MNVIILNAFPGVGKDTLKEYICKVNPNKFYPFQMKDPLIELAVKVSGLNKEIWNGLYTREFKELPSPYLLVKGKQVSPREYIIHLSENVMKPLYGKDFFGKAAAQKLINFLQSDTNDAYAVFSDGGFVEETLSIKKFYTDHIEEAKIFIARLHRYGYDKKNDSRDLLYLNESGIFEKDFYLIDGKISEAGEDILNWVWSHKGK